MFNMKYIFKGFHCYGALPEGRYNDDNYDNYGDLFGLKQKLVICGRVRAYSRVLDSGSMNSESSESHFIVLTCVCTLEINFQNSLQ